MNKNTTARIRMTVAGAAIAALIAGGALGAMPASAASHVSPTLGYNQALHPGTYLESHGMQYRLVMQPDGNLVEVGNGRALWSTRTNGHADAYLKMQTDGNAVVYTSNGHPLWSTQTYTGGFGTNEIGIGADGNVWVKGNSSAVVWQNKAPNTNSLTGAGGTLSPGWYLHSGSAKLIMQTDGNLVSYVGGRAVWSSQTSGHPGAVAQLRSDGNLVVATQGGGSVLFTSHASASGATSLRLGLDGRLTLFRGTTIVWQS